MRTGRKGRRSKEMVEIAKERMDILFAKALEEEAGGGKVGSSQKAERYVDLARRIGMRYNVRMRREHRRAICRSCGAVLPGPRGSRVRVRRGRVIISCKKCGQVRRYRLGSQESKKETEGDGKGKE